jgi:uncharacterized protein (TIGR04255 family)
MYSLGMESRSEETGLTLPSFRQPPVVEVAMSIGFVPIPGLQFAAMADLRSRWMKDYPGAQEQPFLESVPVPQQASPASQQTFRIEFGPPPRRLWLLSSEGDRVVQIQRDRLITNWRAVPGSDQPYPRYGQLRDEFLRKWFDFEKYVAEHGIANSVDPQYAEVTYINIIRNKGDQPLKISAVLKMNTEGELWRKGIRTTAVTQSWELPDVQTLLSTAANVDSSVPGSPIVLQLSANTRIDNQNRDLTAALDLAHDFVVGTFGVITTDEMQRRWERVQ